MTEPNSEVIVAQDVNEPEPPSTDSNEMTRQSTSLLPPSLVQSGGITQSLALTSEAHILTEEPSPAKQPVTENDTQQSDPIVDCSALPNRQSETQLGAKTADESAGPQETAAQIFDATPVTQGIAANTTNDGQAEVTTPQSQDGTSVGGWTQHEAHQSQPSGVVMRTELNNEPGTETPVVFRTSSDIKQPPPASFKKSPSGMLLASTTVLTAVTSGAPEERKTAKSFSEERKTAKIQVSFPEASSTTARIALSLDARRPPANAPALQSVLLAIEKDTKQCAAELVKVLTNTREHVKNATTISLDYMKTMNQNAQNVHSAVDVAVDQASSFIHQVAELEKELSCLDELQINLNLTKEYLTGLEQYVQSL